MNRGKPLIPRRSVLTGLAAALTSAAFVNTGRQSTAQAATTTAPTAPRPPHPSYRSIVGLL